MTRRAVREKGTWLLFVLLAICALLVSGGVTRRSCLNLDISTVNLAYDTDFPTMEEFRAWFDLWQFQWLMGAFGQMCLFPIAVSLFPKPGAPEIRVPVSLGYRREQVWFASMLRFCGQICILSLFCVLAGALASGIRPAEDATVFYYLRCTALHIWRDLGYAGLALFFVLLPGRRTAGMCLSFGLMLALSIFSSSGLLTGTPLHILFARMSAQPGLWMWQLHAAPSIADALTLVLFPVVTFFLASAAGLLRCRADLT